MNTPVKPTFKPTGKQSSSQQTTATDSNKAELFIALIGPIGTDLKKIYDQLEKFLDPLGYKSHHIKLSTLLSRLSTTPSLSTGMSEFERIEILMGAGDNLRRSLKDGGAVAKLGVNEISSIRQDINSGAEGPAYGTAYIIDSIKHEKEIEFLRNMYGQSLWILSVYEPHNDRIKFLLEKNDNATKLDIPVVKSQTEQEETAEKAKRILIKDKGSSQDGFGQNVGKAFHLADVFISKENEELTGFDVSRQIERFVNLLFGAPFITPTKDEYGSFYAHAAALRSADLSRQVGATITTKDGEVIATGCNEVPCAGGGAYWEGNTDQNIKDRRDFKLGVDANAQMKNENVKEILEALRSAGWLSPEYSSKDTQALLNAALYQKDPPAILKDTGIANIIEFGRIVHAEMTAITDAARRGVPLKGSTLYTTTFPCHVCARHILASGISRVVYIEPYPKSHAGTQYKGSIKIDDDTEADPGAVQFDAFMGIAPRVFMPLFTKVDRKDYAGHAFKEAPSLGYPKIRNLIPSYIETESQVVADLVKCGIVKGDENSTTSKEEQKK